MPRSVPPHPEQAVDERRQQGSVRSDVRRVLRELRSETPAERKAKRIVPWIFAVVLHLAIIVLGFTVTWSVVMLLEERPPLNVTADFDAMVFDPVAQLDHALNITDDRMITPMEIDLFTDQAEDPFELVLEPTELLPEALTGPVHVDFSPPPVRGSASFLGISTTNAQRIVYIIDASGGMIPYLQIVLKELERSLHALSDQQSFGVVFFKGNSFEMVPPRRRLIPANRDEKLRVLSWINENIIPAGRSNPLAAFEEALRLKPDVIFLLSDNITGSGIYEIDRTDLLARLEELNPPDRLTGRRHTQINCIQFLDPDPLDTLRMIAELHGGPNGYKFLSRSELGLATR